MPEVLRKGKIIYITEPWRTFIVYGSFHPEGTKDGINFIVCRIPEEKRVPWTRLICPAIKRLIKPWMTAKGRDAFWDVSPEPTLIEEGNVYIGTDTPIPVSMNRLWDTKLTRRFEFDGQAFVEVPRK